jgi:thiol-disulfide isomerase/thioredoxin
MQEEKWRCRHAAYLQSEVTMSREGSDFFHAFSTFSDFMRATARLAGCCLLAGLALSGACASHAFGGDPSPEIAWVENLDQAMQLAKVHNKPLMIHFYGDHCPPCRMLESKAFRNRELVLALNDNVIATRVNADQRRDISQHYQVTRWPTDVYLHADGTLIERGVSNQDPQAYVRTVARVAKRHQDWALEQVAARDARDRRDQQVAVSDLSKFKSRIFGEAAKRTAPVRVSSAEWSQASNMQVINVEEQLAAAGNPASNNPASNNPASNNPASNLPISIEASNATKPMYETAPDAISQSPSSKQDLSNAKQLEALATQPGLGGFCPVALQDFLRMSPESQATRSPWVPGKEEFSVRHRGRVYRCASPESRERLLRDPDAFAPVFSGCDLVEFARSGVLVEGKCDLGFIEQNTGRVFLFSTQASYEEFARNCERYSNLSDPSRDRMAQGPPATNLR